MSGVTVQYRRSHAALILSGKIWFAIAAIGQLAFIIFILGFYGTRTITGAIERWNDKELITGFVEGDFIGNLVFGVHVLLAAVMTASGILQLIPGVRNRWRGFHRANGKVFLITAVILAVSGIWATWVRGSHLSVISGLSVSLNGVLILIFAAQAYRFARARKIVIHEVWAMRLFLAANGVWFFRLGIMAWLIINQGPRGMNATLSGPADIAISFGSYLIPLAAYEIYRAAKRSGSSLRKILTTVMMGLLTLITAIGIFGAMMFMWWPALTG